MLPGLGGRLWSLRDRVTDRELVFTNGRLQFANLAPHRRLVRRWHRVEPGLHRPLGHDEPTGLRRQCAVRPWYRAADLGMGTHPRSGVLGRPADAGRPSLLLAFVRVRNPDPEPKPLYWWTNIAVPEEPGVRVLAPATRAWRTGYDGLIAGVDIPFADDPATDVSYPLPAQRAADYFFQVPPERRPWIAAAQADGTRADPDLHRCVARPEAVLLGYSRRRPALAGVAVRTRFPLPRDPGRSGQHAARAPSAGGERRDQLGGGLRADRSGPRGGTRFLAGRGRRGHRAGGPGGSRGRARRVASLVASRGGREGAAAADGRHGRWRGRACRTRAGSRRPAGHPVRTAPLGRFPPPRRAGSHRRGRPGRRGC